VSGRSVVYNIEPVRYVFERVLCGRRLESPNPTKTAENPLH
jgi:hypothetical protein